MATPVGLAGIASLAARTSAPPSVTTLAPAAPGMPFDVRLIAETALKRPALRGVTVREMATRLQVPTDRAVSAVASIVDIARRVGQQGAAVVQQLQPAPALEAAIDLDRSIDAHLAALASRVGPVSYTASPVPATARGVAGYDDAGDTDDLYWESPNVNVMVSDPPSDGGGASGGRPSGYPYLKIRSTDSIWPAKIAGIATGSEGAYVQLGPINPHLTNPPGSNSWRGLVAGNEINVPESWASKLASAGYDVRRDAAPAPIPDIVPDDPSYPSGPRPSQVLPVRYDQPARSSGGSIVPLLLLGGGALAAYVAFSGKKRGRK